MLRQIRQKADEDINSFTIRLRLQADRCDFGDTLEDNIKDQIIQNCRSTALRRELLKKENPNLDEIIRIAKVFETVAEQEKSFANDTDQRQPRTEEVHKIEVKTPSWRSNDSKRKECGRCGYTGHDANDEKCPAKGKSCNRCGGRDHFGKKCRSRKRHSYENKNIPNAANGNKWVKMEDTKEKLITKSESDEMVKHITNENEEYVFNVTTADDGSEIQCKIGGIDASAVIDSGSKYNLMSQATWKELKEKHVVVTNQRKETGKVFRAYGGHQLLLLGAFTTMIGLNNKQKLADFFVIEGEGKLLIGRDTATAMKILRIGNDVKIIENGMDVKVMGKIKGVLIDIPMKPDAKPVVQPYRRVPVALEVAVDKKIDELLGQGIIEKVNQPSKWISPVIVVPKGDDIRLCLDMRRANESIERENHPLPTIEDFLPHLGKGKVFSKLDIKNAFHQV